VANAPFQLKITDRHDDRGNIMRLTLAAADGSSLPPFDAGSHLDIRIQDRAQGIDLWRQYSLCGDPSEHGVYRLGILNDPASRGGSQALHRIAQPGLVVEASHPRNHFPLAPDARRSILIGGGIGVTPMIAMAWSLEAKGCDFILHYCTRDPERTAFLSDLQGWSFASKIRCHHDNGPDTQRFDVLRDIPEPDGGTHIYVCGPQGFMDMVIDAAQTAGHANENIHREYFSADIDTSGGAFEVVAQTSGVTVEVGADETIVKALARVGVKVEVKCEEGICGTCLTDIIEGLPDHRDAFLTEDERQDGTVMMLCCSRAKTSRLVLDI